jgi:hypothetical protein
LVTGIVSWRDDIPLIAGLVVLVTGFVTSVGGVISLRHRSSVFIRSRKRKSG